MTRPEQIRAIEAAYGVQSARVTAVRLGVTRNAVIGIWKRAREGGRIKGGSSKRSPVISAISLPKLRFMSGEVERTTLPPAVPAALAPTADPRVVNYAVRAYWPRLNTHEIAKKFSVPESAVANALARIRDEEHARKGRGA
jgi:hypothetical protein